MTTHSVQVNAGTCVEDVSPLLVLGLFVVAAIFLYQVKDLACIITCNIYQYNFFSLKTDFKINKSDVLIDLCRCLQSFILLPAGTSIVLPVGYMDQPTGLLHIYL